MRLRQASFRDGVLWVRSGFRVFFRFPLAFTGLFMMFMLAAVLLLVLQWAGLLLALASLPLVTLGFMLATERALKGKVPLPDVFFEPLRGNRARQLQFLKLGALYAVAALLSALLVDAIDGDRLERWEAAMWGQMQARSDGPAAPADAASGTPGASPAPQPDAEAAAPDPALAWSLALRLLGFLPLTLLFWHAPALVHWGGVPVGKSLFFSIVACWRNLGAFVGFALAWFAVALGFGLVTSLLFALLGAPQLVPLAVMPAALMFSTVFYTSLYFTFVGSFMPLERREDEAAAP